MALLSVPVANADAGRRMAVVAGNDLGGPGEVELRFAQTDARRLAQVLRELGGVAAEDLFLLLDEDATAVRKALVEVDARAKASSAPVTLLFFYSGHADAEALHLGATRLAWDELRQTLERSPTRLQVALIDACQAGALTLPKGFVVGAPVSPDARGFAALVSADVAEQAQEMGSLGGSIFTHFLVSGLRGAADFDHDGEVTLAELNSYAGRATELATARWAGSLQHPAFHFDISGRGEIVLSRLRDAVATIHLAAPLEGHLVVSERGSPLIVAEAEKLSGQPMRIAVPSGRYRVHLRSPEAVRVAEAELPWGGTADLTPERFTALSYQSVAQKGALLEVRRHRLQVEAMLQSEATLGMGATLVARLEYGLRFAPFEVGLWLHATHWTIAAVDTTAATTVLGVGVVLSHEWALRRVDWRLFGAFEEEWWRQVVEKEGVRDAFAPTLAVGTGLRVPFLDRLFASLSLEGLLHFANVEGKGSTTSPGVRVSVGAGVAF
ncbi:MAG: caspase family protein [Myxococcaceae bacterium]